MSESTTQAETNQTPPPTSEDNSEVVATDPIVETAAINEVIESDDDDLSTIEDNSLVLGEPSATIPLVESVGESIMSGPFVTKSLKLPTVPTNGYAPTSFGLNLTGKAALALAGLTAGFIAATGNTNLDHGHALNMLLENLADA